RRDGLAHPGADQQAQQLPVFAVSSCHGAPLRGSAIRSLTVSTSSPDATEGGGDFRPSRRILAAHPGCGGPVGMSYPARRFRVVSKRWSTEEIRALAPEPPVHTAAEAAARPGAWPVLGSAEDDSGAALLWGVHAGPPRHRAAVRIAPGSAPGHRCGCRRRASPCEHALALLLLWSAGTVPGSGAPPRWAVRWFGAGPADPKAAARRAARREERAAEGLAELELWLRDQVDAGLAAARGTGYARWDAMAARLVDAQAGRAAERVRDLGGAVAAGGPEWPGRLLAELALLRLLASALLRGDALPEGLRATARSRVGLPASPDASAPVRDSWEV